jgi:formate-dependent nitrite reductase membrane component NrfD
MVMLVWDLDRKDRFFRIMLRPQMRSWLARGAFILTGYGGLCGLCWWRHRRTWARVSAILVWPTILAGFFAAVYTAFLFGQCKGRDLWQTPLLPLHLMVQALLSGAVVLLFLPRRAGTVAVAGLWVCLALHLLIVFASSPCRTPPITLAMPPA